MNNTDQNELKWALATKFKTSPAQEHSKFSKKSRSHEYNYLIISVIKNVERASTAHVRASPETSTCDVPNDV